ncbi:hypothetical protein PDUR_05485 [Paenibacillus durus]|uniref:Uncharacterized protein n=1 Tax=Paenibacillus durus TaxID=44251 RepID=A0A089HLC3_PAEDU|nr:hypothetical protein PDUR_05485 [Paenibacillus durus]
MNKERLLKRVALSERTAADADATVRFILENKNKLIFLQINACAPRVFMVYSNSGQEIRVLVQKKFKKRSCIKRSDVIYYKSCC